MIINKIFTASSWYYLRYVLSVYLYIHVLFCFYLYCTFICGIINFTAYGALTITLFLWRVNDYINIIFIEGISLMTFGPKQKKKD